MELQLKKLRMRAGLNQREMAQKLGVDWRTYGSWERGERMINLSQACQCADILDCTVDEIAGRDTPPRGPSFSDPWQRELNECYEAASDQGRGTIVDVARAVRVTTGEAPQRRGASSEGVA